MRILLDLVARSQVEEADGTDKGGPRSYRGGTTRYHRGTGQISMPMASGDDIKSFKPVEPAVPGRWRDGTTFVSVVTICDMQ